MGRSADASLWSLIAEMWIADKMAAAKNGRLRWRGFCLVASGSLSLQARVLVDGLCLCSAWAPHSSTLERDRRRADHTSSL